MKDQSLDEGITLNCTLQKWRLFWIGTY